MLSAGDGGGGDGNDGGGLGGGGGGDGDGGDGCGGEGGGGEGGGGEGGGGRTRAVEPCTPTSISWVLLAWATLKRDLGVASLVPLRS